MELKNLQNDLHTIQSLIVELNESTMETCRFGNDEETIKVWKSLNQAMAHIEDARVIIHQNKLI